MLFLYVFNDFLNVEVSRISHAMRDTFGWWLGAFLLTLTSAFAGRKLWARSVDQNSLPSFARSLGEHPRTIGDLVLIDSVTILCTFYAPAVSISALYLVTLSTTIWLAIVFMMLLGSWMTYFLACQFSTGQVERQARLRDLLPAGELRKGAAMVWWRTGQIIRRNRLTQICLGLSLVFSSLLALVAYKEGPLFAGILTAYMSGIFIASAVAFQIAEDMNCSWIEKNLGVAHDHYVQAIKSAALVVAAPVAALNGGLWLFISSLLTSTPLSFEDGAKMVFMTLIPVWIAPYLAFQIDARRPFIQIALILLLGLFLCTAVFSHWLALILLPIFAYYAGQSQNGHFYRA